ncbi:Transducin family protein / WD-40 repeat family protein isoform 2 [Capsicum annuum]|nr:Transducin family protein / WD-40 repeat family protein isoform 2 [Capsicum annuum]
MGAAEDDEPPSKRVKFSSGQLIEISDRTFFRNPSSCSFSDLMARPLALQGDDEVVGTKGVVKKVELVRIITEALYSLGYKKTGACLEEESGLPLHSSVVNFFMQQILDGKWDESVSTLRKIGLVDEKIVKLASFVILEQKFLELLDKEKVIDALKTLRDEISPLCINIDRVHHLSSCIISPSQRALTGVSGQAIVKVKSRSKLLEELQRLLPPTVMVPEKRLVHLVEQAIDLQLDACRFHNSVVSEMSLLTDHQCGRDQIPSLTMQILREHKDEVWFLQFSHNGKYLASSSRDGSVIIWELKPETVGRWLRMDGWIHLTPTITLGKGGGGAGISLFPYCPPNASGDNPASISVCQSYTCFFLAKQDLINLPWHCPNNTSDANEGLPQHVCDPAVKLDGSVCLKHLFSDHEKSVSYISWSPDDHQLLTCGVEEVVRRWDVESGQCIRVYVKNGLGLISCGWAPDGQRIFCGATDKSISMWDLEGKELECWKGHRTIRISDLGITSDGKHVVSVCKENMIVLFGWESKAEKVIQEDQSITSFVLSMDKKYVLVSLSNQEIHLWNIEGTVKLVAKYKGHKRSRFVVRSCLGGLDQAFIASGSEDSQVYIWHRGSGELVGILAGHSGTVNCVSWNPGNPHMLASASDDHTIRIWGLDRVNMRQHGTSNGVNCCNGRKCFAMLSLVFSHGCVTSVISFVELLLLCFSLSRGSIRNNFSTSQGRIRFTLCCSDSTVLSLNLSRHETGDRAVVVPPQGIGNHHRTTSGYRFTVMVVVPVVGAVVVPVVGVYSEEARWNKSNTPLHCMKHSLVPKYYHQSWLQGENEIQQVAPNEDLEIASNRIKCFQRYFDSNQMKQVSLEYGKFCSMSGYFGEPRVIDAMEYENPLSWWGNHGVSTPLLQQLAYKLLTQPASSSYCERNWSTYSMIHNIKRNKLATSRAEDLVFVHYNLRLLSSKKEKYINGPSKYWDVGGDQFEVEDTINNLTELSIGEPQLEEVVFDEEFEDLEEVEEDAE